MQSAGSTNFVVVGFVGVILFVVPFFLFFVPSLISTMRLYAKAGKPSWSPIVPVYNLILMAKIGKKPVWMAVVLMLLDILAQYTREFGIILVLGALVFAIILLVAFLKQYTMSLGQKILYVFLPIVFVFMVKDINYIGGTQGPTQAQPVAPVAPQTEQFTGGAAQSVVPQAPQTFGQTTEQSTQNDSINQNL